MPPSWPAAGITNRLRILDRSRPCSSRWLPIRRARCVRGLHSQYGFFFFFSLYTLTQPDATASLSLSLHISDPCFCIHCSHIFTARTRFTSRVSSWDSRLGRRYVVLALLRSMAVIYSDHLSERRPDWQLINTSSRGISIGDFVSDKMGASASVIAV